MHTWSDFNSHSGHFDRLDVYVEGVTLHLERVSVYFEGVLFHFEAVAFDFEGWCAMLRALCVILKG